MTVRLYLDVDGVLNAPLAGSKWGEESRRGRAFSFHDFDGSRMEPDDGAYAGGAAFPGFDISWSPLLVDSLNSLDVELVWLTTWRQDAAESIAPLLGLTLPSRVLHPLSGRTEFPSVFWKYQALIADQEESPAPFIWADDELFDLPHAVVTEVKSLESFLVYPSSHFGIPPADISRMRAFIRENTIVEA